MSDFRTIECADHGTAYASYICRHLISGESTDWHAAEPSEDDEWPDAWCGVCNAFFEAEGEWNEVSEEAANLSENISLLCHHCYERIRANCTTHFD